MSIITMVHHNPLLGNYDGEMTYPNTPALDGSLSTEFSSYPHFVNKFYTKSSNNALSGSLVAINNGWSPHIGKIDYSQNPDKDEFWIRRAAIIAPDYDSYDYQRDCYIGYFYITDVNNKLIKSLQIFLDGNSDVAFRLLNDTGTVVLSGVVAKFASWYKVNSARECFIDIRIKIHDTAGFIQCYDLNGNMAGEYLGKTHHAIKPTHIGLTTVFRRWTPSGPHPAYISMYTPFAIAADEATFGMYVTPLLSKANGRKQQQSSGDYNKHKFMVPVPNRSDAVAMLLDSPSAKQYTALIQSMTDATIPDTHEIKAFQFGGIFDADVGTPNKIEMALTMIDSNGTEAIDSKKSIAINALSDLSANYQRFWSPVHNVSPFTGGNWTKAELSGVEIGFTAYPPTPLV